MTDYHGQEYVEGKPAENVPDAPAAADESLTDRDPGTVIESYAKVVMTGNYGLACAQRQTLTYRNITLAQARKRKWDYFGVCGCVMTCYDDRGRVLHEE